MPKKGPFKGPWEQGKKGPWKKGKKGPWKTGAKKGPWEEAKDEAEFKHGSIETGTTGFAKQYSKSPYRTSQFAMGPGRLEFGKSGTGKKKAEAPAKKVKPRRPPKKGKAGNKAR